MNIWITTLMNTRFGLIVEPVAIAESSSTDWFNKRLPLKQLLTKLWLNTSGGVD